MRRSIRLLNTLLGLFSPKPYFPGEKPVYLFTKRPILHKDFTLISLQNAIYELQAILQTRGLLSNPTGKFAPKMSTAIATAYGLTCVVPFLLGNLPIKQPNQQSLPLFEYAPYMLTGICWKPILNLLLTLVK
jgi:hypothetical protein